MDQNLLVRYNEWMKWDKNENTKKEISDLKIAGKYDILKKLLAKRMNFGTAGLRAKMGVGFSQMNDLTIIQTTQGLLKYAKSIFQNLNEAGIMVGFDGRYNSKKWALIVANIFLNEKCKVYLSDDVIPTPLVAFGVRHLKTCLGIMITASHNPKDDNGYKVYWSNGAQIISPHDKGISDCINSSLEPLSSSWITGNLERSKLYINPMPSLLEDYGELQRKNLCSQPSLNASSKLPIVYTAMHGVGWKFVQFLMDKFQIYPLVPVSQQIEPDPEFPTVSFPNPEEGKKVLKLALDLADSTPNCSIVLANDPDADRLALAEKQADGNWKIFTGNEIGALLGWWLWSKAVEKNPDLVRSKICMSSSNVSSGILRSMSKVEGFRFEETLTGFKWLGNVAHQLMMDDDVQTIFSFEEAIGFMCGSVVLDKDGVGALAVIMELINSTYHENMKLADRLGAIYSKYGQHVSMNSYYICDDPVKIQTMFSRLRNWPLKPNKKLTNPSDPKETLIYPASLGRFEIKSIADLTVGYDSNYPDLKPRLPVSKSSQLISFTFVNGIRLTIRTSGTEPKIKYYSELKAEVDDKRSVQELKAELKELVDTMVDQIYEPTKNGLLPAVSEN